MTECPVATVYHSVNLNNHLQAIELANLGPADPRQPNTLFWGDKMELWNVPEGVARTQLCLNCEHYKTDELTLQCISGGEGATLKPSELPVTPVWADIAGMPVGYCTRWAITCSALRTCDSWEACNWEDQTEDDSVDNMFATATTQDADGWKNLSKAAQTYKPTGGMATEAQRALDWRAEGHRGGTAVGMARANQLVRGDNLSESTVMRMHSFFSRHEVDKKAEGFSPGEKGYPSPGRVAWGLWGGDAGQSWSREKAAHIQAEREKR
jgi:hypothetical protein